MANGSMWAGIAGAANAVGGILASREADDRKQKLYMMEQDILQKRQEALAQVRGDIQDKNAGSRSDRAMERMAYKSELDAGNIVGQFKDPETGSFYGRTKTGQVVPLNITSDDYQSAEKMLHGSKAEAESKLPALRDAQIAHTEAGTENLNSTIDKRDNTPAPDKMGEEIRKGFQANFVRAHNDWSKAAAAATKAGQPVPPFDPSAATDAAKSELYAAYGADAVNASVGGGNNAPKPAPATRQQATAPQTSPTQPQAPSAQELMAQATAAVKARPDKQAEIEARLQQLMQQYGYQPGQ